MNARLTKTENAALDTCILRLKSLCDPKDIRGCGVESAVKEAVRLYVETWITPALEIIAKAPKDRSFTEASTLSFTANESREARWRK